MLLTHNLAGVGGSYMRALSLASHLAMQGHEVTLMASRSKAGFRSRVRMVHGVRQIEMPDLMPRRVRNGGLSPIDTILRSLWILNHRFDVVHGFDHRPAVLLPALIARRVRGATFVSDWADLWGRDGIAGQRGTIFGKLLGEFDHLIETKVRAWADGTTVISRDLARRLSEQGVPGRKCIILPPGSNLHIIKRMQKTDARSILGLPHNAPIVAFSGFAPYDREFLIHVVFTILRSNRNSIVISSGAVMPSLALLAEKEGFADRCIQFGTLPVEEISIPLGAADVLLLPYLDSPINRGRFPNKFGDYLAAGRPIVTHPTGELGELVNQEQLGITSNEDHNEFAEQVLKLLASPDEMDRLGNNVREFAVHKWSWTLHASEVIDFYERMRL